MIGGKSPKFDSCPRSDVSNCVVKKECFRHGEAVLLHRQPQRSAVLRLEMLLTCFLLLCSRNYEQQSLSLLELAFVLEWEQLLWKYALEFMWL